jgi:two-component system, response regulator, stage 0 sporulation protein F
MARILLIDDDETLRSMLSLTLNHFGHTVIEARNGKEGLKLFAQLQPDLVITDMMMPEMEGFEVLLELRKVRPPVKIIAMSGGTRYGAAEYLRMAELMGAAKSLAKPFSNETLRAAIDGLLPGGSGPVPPAE